MVCLTLPGSCLAMFCVPFFHILPFATRNRAEVISSLLSQNTYLSPTQLAALDLELEPNGRGQTNGEGLGRSLQKREREREVVSELGTISFMSAKTSMLHISTTCGDQLITQSIKSMGKRDHAT